MCLCSTSMHFLLNNVYWKPTLWFGLWAHVWLLSLTPFSPMRQVSAQWTVTPSTTSSLRMELATQWSSLSGEQQNLWTVLQAWILSPWITARALWGWPSSKGEFRAQTSRPHIHHPDRRTFRSHTHLSVTRINWSDYMFWCETLLGQHRHWCHYDQFDGIERVGSTIGLIGT